MIYDETKVKLKLNTIVEQKKLFKNPEWKYLSHSSEDEFVDFPVTDTIPTLNWSAVSFSITIKRDPSFYINLFIWPSLLILMITASIFILPPNCIERITMGVLILLQNILLL